MRTLFSVNKRAVILQTAEWLAVNHEKEAAKKLVFNLIKENPKDKASRAVYAQIEKSNGLIDITDSALKNKQK